MKRIHSFQTSDGKLFEDRGEATDHEFMIDLRGFIQRTGQVSNVGNISVTQAAVAIKNGFEEFDQILSRYKRQKAALKPKQPRKPRTPRIEVVEVFEME